MIVLGLSLPANQHATASVVLAVGALDHSAARLASCVAKQRRLLFPPDVRFDMSSRLLCHPPTPS